LELEIGVVLGCFPMQGAGLMAAEVGSQAEIQELEFQEAVQVVGFQVPGEDHNQVAIHLKELEALLMEAALLGVGVQW